MSVTDELNAKWQGQERRLDPAQAFFAAEAKALRTPHFGERQKEWMVSLLRRATEAGLYFPEAL